MYQDFLTQALHAIALADQITLSYFGSATSVLTSEHKEHDERFDNAFQKSPVTNVDKEVETLIKDTLKEHYPDHGFIGEEFGVENPESSYKRIIDPIDGTRNFLRGLPYRATLLALSYNDEIIMSVVSVPVLNQRVRATKGGGAFMNYSAVQVSENQLQDGYVGHSRPSYFKSLGLVDQYFALTQAVAYTKSCISREMIYVATGALDAVITAGGNWYDNAPFKLIVEEAGGIVTAMNGQPFSPDNTSMIASNGIIHDSLVHILT